MPDTPAQDRWYWCLEHRRAEPEATMCRAAGRLGPYGSADEAARWKERVDARNDDWDEQDEEWAEGTGGPGPSTGPSTSPTG